MILFLGILGGVLSVISVSVSYAETAKSENFLGNYQGRCLGKYESIATQISIEADRIHSEDLQIDYNGPAAGGIQETVSGVNRTIQDLTSPYPDTYHFHEVIVKQEDRTGMVQTTLYQKIYSHHRTPDGKARPSRVLKLTLSKSLEASLPDQLVIEGAESYESCVLSRVSSNVLAKK